MPSTRKSCHRIDRQSKNTVQIKSSGKDSETESSTVIEEASTVLKTSSPLKRSGKKDITRTLSLNIVLATEHEQESQSIA